MAWTSPTHADFVARFPEFSAITGTDYTYASNAIEAAGKAWQGLPSQDVFEQAYMLAVAEYLYDLGYGNQMAVGAQTEFKSGDFSEKFLKPNDVSQARKTYSEMYESFIGPYIQRMAFY